MNNKGKEGKSKGSRMKMSEEIKLEKLYLLRTPWPSVRRRDSGDGKPGHEGWRGRGGEKCARRGAESTQASNNGGASNPLLRNRRDVNSLSVKSRRDVTTSVDLLFRRAKFCIYIFFFMKNINYIVR